MNKRLFYISLFSLFATLSYSQLNFDGWSRTYIGVDSYDGTISENAITLRFYYSGTSLYEPYWKLSMQVETPFQSIFPFPFGNNLFPAEKIKLMPVRTEGQAYSPGPLPTVQSIGMPGPVSLNGMSEVFLVPSSNAPLHHESVWPGYYDLKMIFNLMIDGGAYLDKLQNKTYVGTIRFTAYRQDNSIIGIKDMDYLIQIQRLHGNPPPVNEYSISFSTEAANAQIEFISIADYVNGKDVTYTDGLTLSANTNYQVTVRSVDAQFSSVSGTTLPLDILQLQLLGGSGGSLPVRISTDSKTILQGQSTGGTPETYDVIYSIGPDDSRLQDISSDRYSARLMFEITPR